MNGVREKNTRYGKNTPFAAAGIQKPSHSAMVCTKKPALTEPKLQTINPIAIGLNKYKDQHSISRILLTFARLPVFVTVPAGYGT